MTSLDPTVARVIDNAQHESDDEDALIASLEESPAVDAYREQRLQQFHSELSRAKAMKSKGFCKYTEIKDEKTLMDMTTESKYVIVHFFKSDFNRCAIMDGHLEVCTQRQFLGDYMLL